MIRSPFPDVEIPDVPFTDFVLARAGERGDKPALIDGPSGRTITYAELVESVHGLAAGLAERGFGKGDVFAHLRPEPARVRGRVSRRRDGRRREHDREPAADRRGARRPARWTRARACW